MDATRTLYVLHPGDGRTEPGGKLQNINVPTLAKLYGVSLLDCIVVGTWAALQPFVKTKAQQVHLYPMDSGEYQLPLVQP